MPAYDLQTAHGEHTQILDSAPPPKQPPNRMRSEKTIATDEKRTITIDDFQAGVYQGKDGTPLPYRLFMPQHYEPSRKYPLVLHLHARGSHGTDNKKQIENKNGRIREVAWAFCREENQVKYPCFFLAPQQPDEGRWHLGNLDSTTEWLEMTVDLIDSLQKEYPGIDVTRLYVTGGSSGGMGAWDAVAKFPGRFAAAVPLGAVRGAPLMNEGNVTPVWVFYGEDDVFVQAFMFWFSVNWRNQ